MTRAQCQSHESVTKIGENWYCRCGERMEEKKKPPGGGDSEGPRQEHGERDEDYSIGEGLSRADGTKKAEAAGGVSQLDKLSLAASAFTCEGGPSPSNHQAFTLEEDKQASAPGQPLSEPI